MSWLPTAWIPCLTLFLVVRSEFKEIFLQKTFGSYPSCKVYMHIEKLEEVTLIFNKYQSTLLPIFTYLETDCSSKCRDRQKRESTLIHTLCKSKRESTWEITKVRAQTIARINFRRLELKSEQVQTLQDTKNEIKMMWTAEIQIKLQLRCHIFISLLQDTVP